MELCVVGIVRFVGIVRGCSLADWFGVDMKKPTRLRGLCVRLWGRIISRV